MNLARTIQTLLVLALPTAVSLQSGHVRALDCHASGTPVALSSAWQQGNVLLLVRHTEKCSRSHPCEADFGLTVAGFEQAGQLHRALRALGTENTDFLFSPTMRTWSTAWMLAPMAGHRTDDAWRDCDIDFFNTLESFRSPGRNLVVVTHSHCLNALKDRNDMPLLDFNAGDDEFFGLTLAFNASEDSGFDPEPLACRLPGSWLNSTGDLL